MVTPNWYQSLLLDMAKGRYLNLSPRPRTESDWLILWGLIQAQSAIYTSLERPAGGMVLSATNEELEAMRDDEAGKT